MHNIWCSRVTKCLFAVVVWLCFMPVPLAAQPPAPPQVEIDTIAWKRYPIEVFANLTSMQQGGSIGFYVAAGDSFRLSHEDPPHADVSPFCLPTMLFVDRGSREK